jgi:hypothetical protein
MLTSKGCLSVALLSNLFRSAIRPNKVWNIALHSVPDSFEIDRQLPNATLVFSSHQLRRSLRHIHTRADPFLFAKSDELYLFFEEVEINWHGRIEAYKTRDMITFAKMGTILELPYHLSYPAVFNHGRSVYMIPESSKANEVALFKFKDFPFGLEKVNVILNGFYVDTSPLYYEGVWYLFTTSSSGLEIFFTTDISNGPYHPHPKNPITCDPRFSRSGGLPVIVNGRLFRIAQDCSKTYGGNLNILRVFDLSTSSYREELVREGFVECDEPWNSEGGHHLSVAHFRGETVVATDGKQNDYLANKFLSPVFRTVGWLVEKRGAA